MAPPALGFVVHGQRGRLFSVYGSPVRSLRAAVDSRAAAPARFTYHGGPVLQTSAPYLVFWDPSAAIPASWRQLLPRYFADLAQTNPASNNVNDVLRQYTDSSGFANLWQFFDPAAQTIVDRQPYPTSGGCGSLPPGISSCLTDDQIGQELTRLAGSDGLRSGLGFAAPIYFVVLPPSVNACIGGGECASNYFCGYHSYVDTGNQPLLYAVVPSTMFDSGEDPKTCQSDGYARLQKPNGTRADALVATLGHEDAEVLTDPLMDGWYATSEVIEVADLCAAAGPAAPLEGTSPDAFTPVLGGSAAQGNLFDQVIGSGYYYLQSIWSNGAGGCQMRPAAGILKPRFTAASAGGTTVDVNMSSSLATAGYSSATWQFGDGTRATFLRGARVEAPVAHTYRAPGRYAVTLTLVDRGGNIGAVTAPVEAGGAPFAMPLAVAGVPRAGRPSSRSAKRLRHRHHHPAPRRAYHRHKRVRRHRITTAAAVRGAIRPRAI